MNVNHPLKLIESWASSCACLPWGSCACPHWCPFPSSTCTAAFVSHSIFCGSLCHSHCHYLMLMFLFSKCLILIICCLAAVSLKIEIVIVIVIVRSDERLQVSALNFSNCCLDVVSLKIRCQLWSLTFSVNSCMIWTSFVSLWAGWCDHSVHKRASFVTISCFKLIMFPGYGVIILIHMLTKIEMLLMS